MEEFTQDFEDVAERRIQRLEQRYFRAEVILQGARARLSMLQQVPGISDLQLLLALKMQQMAERRVEEIALQLDALETGVSLN